MKKVEKKEKFILSSCVISLIALNLCLGTQVAQADTDSENATLARIVQELNHIEPLINQAEKQQPPYTRIYFNYGVLRADVRKIKSGIQQQLAQENMEPRPVQPISGDYIEVQRLKP